jgi:hypothetical protein
VVVGDHVQAFDLTMITILVTISILSLRLSHVSTTPAVLSILDRDEILLSNFRRWLGFQLYLVH